MAKSKVTPKEELAGLVVATRGLVDTVDAEATKLVEEGVKAAATRARKALMEIRRNVKVMRGLVLEIRNEKK